MLFDRSRSSFLILPCFFSARLQLIDRFFSRRNFSRKRFHSSFERHCIGACFDEFSLECGECHFSFLHSILSRWHLTIQFTNALLRLSNPLSNQRWIARDRTHFGQFILKRKKFDFTLPVSGHCHLGVVECDDFGNQIPL